MNDRHEKGSKDRIDVQATWQHVYSALMMILLVFFVALFANSTMGKDRTRDLRIAVFGGNIDREKSAANAISPEEWKNLQEAISSRPPQGIAHIDRTEKGVRIRVATAALFQEGKTNPLPQALPFLINVGEQASKGNWRVVIETALECGSYTGTRSVSGWELAAMRSALVRRYLIERGGMGPELVKAYGTGRSCQHQHKETAAEREGETTIYLIR